MLQQKEMVKIVNKADETRQKHPEERQYLICLRCIGDQPDEWDVITGRTEAYEYIKNAIEYINFDESFILVETLKFADRKSIVAFMQYAQEFYDDEFDIADYIRGDWDEDDYKTHNEITPVMDIPESQRLTMEQIMNGDIQQTPLE